MNKLTTKTASVAAALLLTLIGTAAADNKQVVTVDGQQLTQAVTRLTFDDDRVLLHLADGTTRTVDMTAVIITFTVADALKALQDEDAATPLTYFDLKGRQLKEAPKSGAYIIVKGKKMVKLMKKD